MPTYSVRMGNPGDRGEDYGTIEGETPEAAVVALARDLDSTRTYTARHLSPLPGFGQGHVPRSVPSGFGSQNRDGWLYLTDVATGRFAGIYVADTEEIVYG